MQDSKTWSAEYLAVNAENFVYFVSWSKNEHRCFDLFMIIGSGTFRSEWIITTAFLAGVNFEEKCFLLAFPISHVWKW